MSLENVIRERRTVHSYNEEAIDQGTVEKALELALLAPNHKHTQPWFFVDVQKGTRERIIELALETSKKNKPDEWSELKEKTIRQKFGNPSHLIVLCQKKSETNFQTKEDYASIACAVQNMSLFLWEKGIGTKWSTGAVTRSEKLYDILGVDKSYALEGFFWIGKALTKKQPLPPKARNSQMSW